MLADSFQLCPCTYRTYMISCLIGSSCSSNKSRALSISSASSSISRSTSARRSTAILRQSLAESHTLDCTRSLYSIAPPAALVSYSSMRCILRLICLRSFGIRSNSSLVIAFMTLLLGNPSKLPSDFIVLVKIHNSISAHKML